MAHAVLISDLPDALLARILVALASPEPEKPGSDAQELVAGRLLSTACRVCRRWRDAVYGEPALWSAFTLRGDWHSGQPPQQQVAWLAATHILLRRVGHHVAAFSACGCEELERFSAGAVGLAHFLGLLHPSRLTKLSLHGAQLPDDAVLVAGSLSRLSALRLHSYEAPIPPCAASMLQQLPHLQHLQLDTPLDEDPGPTLRALAGLTGLTSLGLVLTTNQALHLQLPRLRHLNLYGGGVASGLASFPELESYQLARFKLGCTGAVCVRDVHYKAGHLWFDGTWKLGDSIRRPLQPAVLNALLLPSCSRLSTLSRLDLSCCELEGAPPACPQLAGVAALRLCGCLSCDGMEEEEEEEEEEDSDADSERAAIRAGRGVSRAALSALLRQVPAATDLTIEECLAGDPAALDSSALPPGLTLLSLRCNELHQVPAGPYPSGLLELDLGHNALTRLPPELAACTALTRLALDGNEDLVLGAEDVTLLQRLPRLAQLELGAEALLAPRVRRVLQGLHPGLQLSFTWGDTESEGTTSSGSDWEEEGEEGDSMEEEGEEGEGDQ